MSHPGTVCACPTLPHSIVDAARWRCASVGIDDFRVTCVLYSILYEGILRGRPVTLSALAAINCGIDVTFGARLQRNKRLSISPIIPLCQVWGPNYAVGRTECWLAGKITWQIEGRRELRP